MEKGKELVDVLFESTEDSNVQLGGDYCSDIC